MTLKLKKTNTTQMMLTRMKIQHYISVMFKISLIVFTPILANAANLQSSESLRSTVQTFLEQQTALQHEQEAEITVGRLDRRLRLTECSTTPSAFLAPGAKLQGKFSVGLRCSTGKKHWTVYIPAQIKNYANIVTAAHSLPRGRQISDSDLMITRQEISQVRGGYFTKNKNVIGKILKRSMSGGEAFTARKIKSPLLVHRGDEVAILASVGGLQVRVKGKALKDAALGERIPVRNKQSKRIVQGTAVRPGVVSVQM